MKRIIGAILVLTVVLTTAVAIAFGGDPDDETLAPSQAPDNTSEVGSGACFSFTRPLAPRDGDSTARGKDGGGLHILVVEDDRNVARLIRRHLERAGYSVSVAYTGEDAWLKALQQRPRLITLDIILPDMSGFDVLERLKGDKRTEEIPVVVLSIVQGEDRALRLGAVSCLIKPFSEQELVENIGRALGQRPVGRVLVADDEPGIVRLLTRVLARCGYEAIVANHGAEALALARQEMPDLILLDIKMPHVDGITVMRRLKRDSATRDIPIMVMTGSSSAIQEYWSKGVGLNVEDMFTKPLDLDRLIQRIDELTSSHAATG